MTASDSTAPPTGPEPAPIKPPELTNGEWAARLDAVVEKVTARHGAPAPARVADTCPSLSPETNSPCILLDTEEFHAGGHESARVGSSRALWPFICEDYVRWRQGPTACVWAEPEKCSVHGDGSNGVVGSLRAAAPSERVADTGEACPWKCGCAACELGGSSPAAASPGTADGGEDESHRDEARYLRAAVIVPLREERAALRAEVALLVRQRDEAEAALAARDGEVRREDLADAFEAGQAHGLAREPSPSAPGFDAWLALYDKHRGAR